MLCSLIHRDGRNVSKEENELFVDIFKLCRTGKLDYEHFYITDYYDRSMYTTTIYGEIFLHTLSSFLSMVRIYLHMFGISLFFTSQNNIKCIVSKVSLQKLCIWVIKSV